MIKTVPHGTVSPQMMYKKYKRLVYTSPDLLARFCKINCKLVERKKLGLICFPRICFPGLICLHPLTVARFFHDGKKRDCLSSNLLPPFFFLNFVFLIRFLFF